MLLLACAAVLLAGCATSPDDEMVPRPTAVTTLVSRAASPLPRLTHGASTYVQGVPARVRDGSIHVGPRTVSVAPLRADQAVASRGGTYFLNAGELWYLGGHGARSTGFDAVTHLVVSADGRFLGFVDRNHGPSRPGDAPLAAAVVYDTASGRPVLRSTAGMGSLSDDLRRTYAARPPRALALSDAALVVRAPEGRFRYPLDGGTPSRLG